MFTITNAKGLHGEVENTRYPKVGDPNPSVKVGIVSADGGDIVWTKTDDKASILGCLTGSQMAVHCWCNGCHAAMIN